MFADYYDALAEGWAAALVPKTDFQMKFWIGQFFSDGKAHWAAGVEVFFVCVISLIPLLLLALIDQLRLATEFSDFFHEAIAAGQLYLYAFSLLGTLFWLC